MSTTTFEQPSWLDQPSCREISIIVANEESKNQRGSFELIKGWYQTGTLDGFWFFSRIKINAAQTAIRFVEHDSRDARYQALILETCQIQTGLWGYRANLMMP